MCGIYGAINFDGKPVAKETLSTMGNQMLHRGPDGEGNLIAGPIGIGMRRLAIIDPIGGEQPISNEDGSIHIILNGEIYNHKELRNELIQRGHRFKTQSDVECVVHLYEEFGTACLNRLNGMFAFALFDTNYNRLWLVRDRLGIKPLFYRKTIKQFIFSSDLNSLRAVTDVEINESSLIKYLGFSYVPEPETIYQDVKKLGCGEQIIIENSNFQLTRYWTPFASSPFEGTIKEATTRLEEILTNAAEIQIRSDVPLGIFLSGGVDSSALAAYVANLNGADTLKTFTIDFLGKGGQDTKYSKIMAESIGAEHNVIEVNSSNLASALDELLSVVDEPLSDSAIVPTYMLSKYAREQGIKVLLSGAGGDEVFGGYSRHFPKRLGSAAWLAQSKLARGVFNIFARQNRPNLAWRFATPARNFGISISGTNLELLNQSLNYHEHFDDLLNQYEQVFYDANSLISLDRMNLDLQNYLPNNILALTDKATMAASVEGRVPLLDHRLVEFAFSLPSTLNPLDGKDKGLFKKILKNHLPKEVLTRKKEGFNAPMNEWVERDPHAIREEILGNTAPILKNIFKIKVLEDWLQNPKTRYIAGDTIFSIYLLNKWLCLQG